MTHRSPRAGFTVIEVLVVVIVLAIVVVVAVPRYRHQKQKDMTAGMEADLRHLAGAEGEYYSMHSTYARDVAVLDARFTSGNVVVVNEATPAGWSATVSNPRSPIRCYVWHGNATPVGSAVKADVISCS